MAGIVHSVGGLVEAGVKGLIDLAEGYIHPESAGDQARRHGAEGEEEENNDEFASANPLPVRSNNSSSTRPIPIGRPANETEQTSGPPSSASTTLSTATSSSRTSSPSALIQTVDVPSGWIHLPSTYVDGTQETHRRVRSFGVKNVTDAEVGLVVDSDLGKQLTFWVGDTRRNSPGSSIAASPRASFVNHAGTTVLHISLPALSTMTIFLSFAPSPDVLLKPPTPSQDEDAVDVTPRLQPVSSRSGSNAASDLESLSGSSSQSVSGSIKSSTFSARKPDPVHRAHSIHGSIAIRASTQASEDAGSVAQVVNLPFFATVCQSLFTASLIDPASGLVTGQQLSSGSLTIDFGSEPVVGQRYYRDILLVNRSEIDLVWNTSVLHARHKDSAWFSLRDLDSENVFGIDRSTAPVPLPALSSRHLRLELRVLQPTDSFDFEFAITNAHAIGNVVMCRAVGSGLGDGADSALKILSGTSLDFGQICDGVWAKKLVTCKNAGDRSIDVKLSATEGHDVLFRLAGVAGDDMDEDLVDRPALHRKASDGFKLGLSRVPTRNEPRGRDTAPSSSRLHSPSASSMGRSSYHDHQWGSELASRLDEEEARSAFTSDRQSSNGRDPSLASSRPLSRVASRNSNAHWHADAAESDDDEPEQPFLGGLAHLPASPSKPSLAPAVDLTERTIPNQIEELSMRPGTEYRIFVLCRPKADRVNPPEIAGALRRTDFQVFFDSSVSQRSAASRRTINCTAESCTSLIRIAAGGKIDFGEVTVGASKSATIGIENLSQLSAKVEIAAISKVLSTNRNVIVIPPREIKEEKLEFFPRRINDRYEKQIFVRNLLNRQNDQLVDIRAKNVDVYNLTLHSHLYRILTPSGSNFLDFGSVVINSPTVRSVLFENLTFAPLSLALTASQPEDVELYFKLEDAPPASTPGAVGKYADESPKERVASPPTGELKERFMETLRELAGKDAASGGPAKKEPTGKKARDKSATGKEEPKQSVAASVAAALKKGGRGRPVQLYGNSVVFKDRHLLECHEYLDLAAGPPVAAHRTSPRSKKTLQLLDTIEMEDKTKLSGQHPKVPKLDFAASAKASGLLSKAKKSTQQASSPKSDKTAMQPPPSLAGMISAMANPIDPTTGGTKSPALTGKKAEPKTEMFSATDVSKMGVDELLIALEQHDSKRGAMAHTTPEEEEQFVRRTIALRKELQNLISAGKLVPARSLSVPPRGSKQLIVIMTPNGSTRPHISTRAKRADSRIFIRLLDFDRSLLNNGAAGPTSDLPVRELMMRSSCIRSVLEVQQTSINFGTCDKGEVKSKTIVLHNKSDCVGLFRLRTSGSIASGDLKLGLGRYGVISAFGRKEVENFEFTPSLVGNFQEAIVVENVLDSLQEQSVAVKAAVRRIPTFSVEPGACDLGVVDMTGLGGEGSALPNTVLTLTNVSKKERVFVVEVEAQDQGSAALAFAQAVLSRDEGDAGVALSKAEEEEAEGMLQKLKIARRKGKADKVAKYEARLTELGVPFPPAAPEDAESTGGQDEVADQDDDEQKPKKDEKDKKDKKDKKHKKPKKGEPSDGKEEAVADEQDKAADGESLPQAAVSAVVVVPAGTESAPGKVLAPTSPVSPSNQAKTRVPLLNITLQPSKKARILIELAPGQAGAKAPLSSVIRVYEKKNTDEVVMVPLTAVSSGHVDDAASSALASTSDALHLALMRYCLDLTLKCPVSPTAFCVGSALFLPNTAASFQPLSGHFPSFASPSDATAPAGLILGDGYSRQIPGNTHAEANALANFREAWAALVAKDQDAKLPPMEQVLQEAVCYATMEPCSTRTSGGPSCALELVRAKVHAVYLGVEEPPDFVQCEGVQILQQGGVDVIRVTGLEEDCLKAARRGRE